MKYKNEKCSICRSGDKFPFLSLYDDRYGYPGTFELFACRDCGHKTLEFESTPDIIRELYTEYYPRSDFRLEDHKPYKEAHGFLSWVNGYKSSPFRWVPKNTKVLDIGCGFGETLGYFEARGCEAYGVEADENIRRVAEKFGYKVYVGLFTPDIYEPDFFDYVTMAQVIEHMTDPVETLKGVSRVLKPGGYAILSTPNSNGWGARVFGRKWINWHAPYHIQQFSLNSMEIAAKAAGLIIEKHKTITSSEWLYYQWLHLVTCPNIGDPSVFWSPKGRRTFVQRAMIAFITLIHKFKVNHLLTRIFDAMNIGDNFVFVLKKPL